jgi:hypothetical protein
MGTSVLRNSPKLPSVAPVMDPNLAIEVKDFQKTCFDLLYTINHQKDNIQVEVLQKKFENTYNLLIAPKKWKNVKSNISLFCYAIGTLISELPELQDQVLQNFRHLKKKVLADILQLLSQGNLDNDNKGTSGLFWLCVEITTNSDDCDSVMSARIFGIMLQSNSKFITFIFHRPAFVSHILGTEIERIAATEKAIPKLEFFLNIVGNHLQYLSTELMDHIVISIHDQILNSMESTQTMKSLVYQIMMKISIEQISRGQIVTPANVDKILQFAVYTGHLTQSEYIQFLTLFTDTDMVVSSLMSLELLLFPHIAEITFSSTIDDVDWESLVSYLDLYCDFLQKSTVTLPSYHMRTIYDLILILSKMILIPELYHDKVRLYSCKILNFAYSHDIVPFDHQRFFHFLLSICTFSLNLELRIAAAETIMSMIQWEPELLHFVAPASKLKPATFIKKCEQILPLVNKAGDHFEIISQFHKQIYLSRIISHSIFNFTELFYELNQFAGIGQMEILKKSIDKYHKNLSDILLEHMSDFQSYTDNMGGRNIDFPTLTDIISIPLNKPSMVNKYKNMRAAFTPLYPSPSLLETRLYLFILLMNPSKRILESADLMLRETSKYHSHADVYQALVDVFSTYQMKPKLIDLFIQNRKREGFILVEIWNECSSFLLSCATYEHKHLILDEYVKSAHAGELMAFWRFFRSLIDAQNGKINEEPANIAYMFPRDIVSRYTFLLDISLVFYKDWDNAQRNLFWAAFTKSITSFKSAELEISEGFSLLATILRKDKAYMLTNKNLSVVLCDRIVNENKGEALNSIINEALKTERTRQASLSSTPGENIDTKPMATPSQKRKSKRKTSSANEEILKVQNIQLNDSDEVREISIMVYPAGKKTEEDIGDGNHIEEGNDANKKLTPAERKSIFLEEAHKGVSNITKCYYFYMTRIVNDLFKGVFSRNQSIGKFVGLLFQTDINFSTASDKKILQVLSRFQPHISDFQTLLFIKFGNYLENRINISHLKKKLQDAQKLIEEDGF